METMAKRLKRLRVKRGLKQSEVAKLIGISVSIYRDWEYGKQIQGEPYQALATALGVSISVLVTGKDGKVEELFAQLQRLAGLVEIMRKTASSL